MTGGRIAAATVTIVSVAIVLACMLILIPDGASTQQATLVISGPSSSGLEFTLPPEHAGITDISGAKSAFMTLAGADGVGMNVSMTTTVTRAFGIANNGYSSVSVSLIKEGDMVSAVRFTPLEDGVVLGPGESVTIDVYIDTSGGICGSEILKRATIWATSP